MKKSDKALEVLKTKLVALETAYPIEVWLDIVNRELDLDSMVSLSTLRKLFKRIPVNKYREGRKMVYGVALPQHNEVLTMLKELSENGSYPLMLEKTIIRISQSLVARAIDVDDCIYDLACLLGSQRLAYMNTGYGRMIRLGVSSEYV